MINSVDFDSVMPYTKLFLGQRPYPIEIREGIKHCGLTRKQWEKKKREKKNRKKARKQK
jgi:hypothetical protein